MKFVARERFDFLNGAIGWRPGGPFDCLWGLWSTDEDARDDG